ncbi:hypothetical protein PilKf_02623 [Pillotina sp. SPG140]
MYRYVDLFCSACHLLHTPVDLLREHIKLPTLLYHFSIPIPHVPRILFDYPRYVVEFADILHYPLTSYPLLLHRIPHRRLLLRHRLHTPVDHFKSLDYPVRRYTYRIYRSFYLLKHRSYRL